MRIVVLNGSPKGHKSVTLQYIHYIRQTCPQHRIDIIDITRPIRRLETDRSAFDAVIAAIRAADGILWATPVYYFLVPAGYKRFIELIFETGVEAAFNGKTAAALTTSIHFYDHTAHNYLHAICDDLDMHYAGGYSADMYDLLKPAERRRLAGFADLFFGAVERREARPKVFSPLVWSDFAYRPAGLPPAVNPGRHKITVVADTTAPATNLGRMIRQLTAAFGGRADLIDLSALDVKGSCLGCMHCAWDNTCVYAGKDDYIDVYRRRIMPSDILIWAGTMTDRYLSATWKTFFDRSFFMNHTPTLAGKQMGMLIAGPLAANANLRQILAAYIELQQAGLVGIVTDEAGDSVVIDAMLADLARRLVHSAERRYTAPATFLGVAGTRLFRDEIWGRLRFPFRADYLNYTRMGLFDFPQRNLLSRLRNAVMLMLSRHPRFRREVNRRMKDEMIKPLAKVLSARPAKPPRA